MKKSFLLTAVAAFAFTAQAEVITLDLSKPNYEINYDENGLWEDRFNEDEQFSTLDFQIFSFNHFTADYDGYLYASLFTISKDAETSFVDYSTGQFRNVVGHGAAGEGSPFLVAYDDGGWNGALGVGFLDQKAHAAVSVDICQSAATYKAIKDGLASARAFEGGDELTIEFTGINENGETIEGNKVIYHLADYTDITDPSLWTINTGWETVDLSALGEVYGILCKMVTTDIGDWGANTPLYFCLDKLVVEEAVETGLSELSMSETAAVAVYTVAGQYLKTVVDAPQNIINALPQGSYLLRSADKVLKIVK